MNDLLYLAIPVSIPVGLHWTATPWGMLWVGFAVVSLMMTGVTLWATRHRNAGLVDVAWAAGFVLLAAVYVALGHGWPPRQALAAGLLAVANARLTWHLWQRFKRHPHTEDVRYAALRQVWLAKFGPLITQWLFVGVFYGQGVLLTLLTWPVVVCMPNPQRGFAPTEWLGALCWVVGMLVAAVADMQLAEFKQRTQYNSQLVCNQGLWGLSRHPNYVGEWLTWFGYWLVACGSPGGFATVWVPLVMYVLLRYLSGVGATEAQALLRKGEAYRQYQANTPVFFPTWGGLSRALRGRLFSV
jgi:steroid 5-alpha reductase family enzyme